MTTSKDPETEILPTIWHRHFEFPNSVKDFSHNDLENFVEVFSEQDPHDISPSNLCLIVRRIFETTDSRDIIDEELKESTKQTVEDIVECQVEEVPWEKHAEDAVKQEKSTIRELVDDCLQEKDQYCEQLDQLAVKVAYLEEILGIENDD